MVTYIKLDKDMKEVLKVEVDQRSLTSDCWTVQFEGLSACKPCPNLNKPECGGGETLKRIKKELTKNV